MSLTQFAETGTLAAGVAKVLTYNVREAHLLGIVLANTGGTNAIDSTKVEKSPLGTLFATDTALGTAIGSIAANGAALVETDASAHTTLRLTLTSTSGTTYSLEIRGT